MKKEIVSFIIFFSISVGIFAQSSAIDRYFEKYQDDDRFTQITVSSRMFGLFVNFEMDDPSEQELVETISNLKGLKILASDSVANVEQLFTEASNKPKAQMDELLSIKEGEAEFNFYINETDGKINELLMVGKESNSIFILSLVGNIDLKQISALSKKMNIDAFEHFEHVE